MLETKCSVHYLAIGFVDKPQPSFSSQQFQQKYAAYAQGFRVLDNGTGVSWQQGSPVLSKWQINNYMLQNRLVKFYLEREAYSKIF